jgi:hypothetical protein
MKTASMIRVRNALVLAGYLPLLVACGGTTSTNSSEGPGAAGAGGASPSGGTGGAAGSAGGAQAGAGGANGGTGGATSAGAGGAALAGAGGSGGSPAMCTDAKVAASTCASTFGTKMSVGFGRIDGTLRAIVPPADKQCAMPDSFHVALDVEMDGAVYRLVARVYDDQTPGGSMYFAEHDGPLPAPAFSPGWHVGASMSYPKTLGVHSAQFSEQSQSTLVSTLLCELTIGAPIAVYATGYGPDGGHDVHKTGGTSADGAIVVHPDQPTSHYLLFHFQSQTF